MKYDCALKGVCAAFVSFDMDEGGVVRDISFKGGCNGNLKAIARLTDGWFYGDIIAATKGNTCGTRPTSCTDRFAAALQSVAEEAGL